MPSSSSCPFVCGQLTRGFPAFLARPARSPRFAYGDRLWPSIGGDAAANKSAGEMLMLSLTLRLVATALGLSGLIAATTLPVRAQSQLYAEAKSEGAFVFYVGGPTAPWEAKAKIFEQRYPGIKVSITGGFSNVLDKKIDQQLKDGKLEVDAAIFQTLHDFVRWKAQGQLLHYKPEGFDAIDPSFKDPDGTFYGTMV